MSFGAYMDTWSHAAEEVSSPFPLFQQSSTCSISGVGLRNYLLSLLTSPYVPVILFPKERAYNYQQKDFLGQKGVSELL